MNDHISVKIDTSDLGFLSEDFAASNLNIGMLILEVLYENYPG